MTNNSNNSTLVTQNSTLVTQNSTLVTQNSTLVKVPVYNINGEKTKEIKLPSLFNFEIRPDIIKRAVVALQSSRRKVYGPGKDAGMKHVVEWWGKGRGVARTPRLKNSNRGAQAPNTVGGRRAHPPKLNKNYSKKLNKKESRIARASALSATAKKEFVKSRGHIFDDSITLPVIVDESVVSEKKSSQIINFLKNLKIYDDIVRAKNGTKIRAGKAKMRNRKYKVPRSILFVHSSSDGFIGARNLPGTDVVSLSNLNTEHLAPGGIPGRLTVYSLSAIQQFRAQQRAQQGGMPGEN